MFPPNLLDYAPQAEYHANNARSILMHGGHAAGSMEEKAQLYAVLIQVYRLTGQACTVLNKYVVTLVKTVLTKKKIHCLYDIYCICTKQ